MAKVERESINFKLPKPLADALRAKAAELNTTATDLVIQGLHHVLGDVPGIETSVEVRLYQIEEEFFSFKSSIGESTNPQQETRLTNVEAKLEALTNQLARFEGALMQMQNSINASKSRKSSYNPYQYNNQPLQLQPFDELSLARRLNTNAATLAEKRTTCDQQEFDRWCKERDTSQYAWHFNEKDGLYHPVK
jgi:septal ring factor EnvC (AmiA/AmiB activator)